MADSRPLRGFQRPLALPRLPREFARRIECRQERLCGKFERLVFMSERMLSFLGRASHRAAHRLWLRAAERERNPGLFHIGGGARRNRRTCGRTRTPFASRTGNRPRVLRRAQGANTPSRAGAMTAALE